MTITFRVDLSNIVEALGEMGANDMGDLSFAQAALFHHATALLKSLEEDLDWPRPSPSPPCDSCDI